MGLLKRNIVLLTLLGMFVQINCVLTYYGLFYLNRKAIAESACEKMTMECGGHCFLQKKIDAEQDPQPADSGKKASSKSPEEMLAMMHGLEPEHMHPHLAAYTGNKYYDHSIYDLRSGSLRRIDHPPEA
ncbi:MAG: hypothetical protein HGB22_03435 [Chlorobiaceae bacterium]|nr:hypothetical protein [Chlorobiaceae bacterium]